MHVSILTGGALGLRVGTVGLPDTLSLPGLGFTTGCRRGGFEGSSYKSSFSMSTGKTGKADPIFSKSSWGTMVDSPIGLVGWIS